MNSNPKRERLIEAAAELFHRRGISATSLADIAKHADIPIGNVYYYFKTKEELALAAVEKHREELREAYANLDESLGDPRERLIAAIQHFEAKREEYAQYGCPVGKMVCDSASPKDAITQASRKMFEQFIGWAERQFAQLGHADDATRYATSLLTAVEGAALMSKALCNPQVFADEMARVTAWLEALPNRKIFLGKAGIKLPEAAA